MEEMVQITRAHSLEEHEIGRIGGFLSRIAKSGFNLDMIQAYFGSFLWITIQIFQLGSLVFSGYMAYQGKISVGDITLFQTYFNTLTWQISALINLFPIFSKGTEAISSIGEILGSLDIEESGGKERLEALTGEYEFENVTFSYEATSQLLYDFDLSVKAGETVALVGESGSGKSTLINLAIGFMHPQKGRILVDGKDLANINLQSYRKNIAIVPQNSVLFTGSIRENITYGLENISEEKLNNVLKASLLYDFVNTLPNGVDSSLNEHGANLSGGQKQRISIARALIRDPSVIILDEATSALDNVSEREIQRAINNLCKDRTTFIVAHRLSTIRNADKIAVLKEGRCVELGTYDELLALNGEFAKMHHASELSIDDMMLLQQ
jgi:ATP-binding cassette subfamily B protein